MRKLKGFTACRLTDSNSGFRKFPGGIFLGADVDCNLNGEARFFWKNIAMPMAMALMQRPRNGVVIKYEIDWKQNFSIFFHSGSAFHPKKKKHGRVGVFSEISLII